MNYIIRHDEKIKESNFGGKANSLLKLTHNGIEVPKFYIISSYSFLKFIEFNHIELKEKPEEIKNKIDQGIFPDDLEKEIFKYWNDYGFTKASIRSSASNEDGENKSFAGQYKTFLNVEKKDLILSIKECWKSLYDDNVIAYNNNKNQALMNIIIEEMINADFSGVAFSIDPTSQNKNYSIVEVVNGLGNQLVSGSITPSTLYVRRQTGRCDLHYGNVKLEKKYISDLEDILIKIESLYNHPVDVEWCLFKEKIYILQARPITAFNVSHTPYKKVISREKSLIETEIYYKGEYEGIKSLTEDLYYFKPLFIYDKEKGITNVYYNDSNLEEGPNNIYYYMQKNISNTRQLYEKALLSCDYLNSIIDNGKSFNYKLFIHNMLVIYPFTSLGNLAGYFEDINPDLKNLLIDFRNNYDYILYKANEFLLNQAKEMLPEDYKKYLKFLFIDEIFNKKLPSKNVIEERKKGYIFFNNKLELVEVADKWLKENNISIKKTYTGTTVKGNVAYSGIIKGKVCQVYRKEDFDRFEKGDILVTTMTTPKFTPILKSAGAIVTDEGGITCHAAIIARELKVPCVIGCKNATEVLKDGMIVEVNATEGIINII